MGTILNHKQLSEAIDVAPSQLTGWRKKGMPFVSNETSSGGPVTYDLAAVFKWVRDAGRFSEGEEGGIVPAVEQAKLARSRRLKVDLERRVKCGELVTVRKVQSGFFPVVRSLRDGLLAIPDRLAPILAAQNDETTLHATLSAEIRAMLESSEDELRAVAESLSEGENIGGVDSEE